MTHPSQTHFLSYNPCHMVHGLFVGEVNGSL